MTRVFSDTPWVAVVWFKVTSSAIHVQDDSTTSGDAGDGAAHQENLASAVSEATSGQDISGVAQQMNSLSLTQPKAAVPHEDKSGSNADFEKRIRGLRQKIRLAESLQASSSSTAKLTPEQVEKLSKLDTLRKELEDLEFKLTAAIH